MQNDQNSPIGGPPERLDRLDGITVFVETVRLGSFARAAEHLGLTRSAVGKAMARLESRLATRLFHRSTRVQSLTDDGRIYYEHCHRALAELQAAQAQFELGRHEVAGKLRVSMPVLFGRHCVAPVLLDLARQHPQLALQLSFSDRPVDVLSERIDLAIRLGPLGRESEGLRARKLTEFCKVICASPAYIQAHGAPSSPMELTQHAILNYRRGDHLLAWRLENAQGRVVDMPLESRLSFDDLESIANAAVAGMGIAWLPVWLVKAHLASGALSTVLNAYYGESMECHALWPSESHMPLRLRLAVDTLLEKLPFMLSAAEDGLGES
ncbi:LysR family transcriptional regulator [Undibacterium sp. MH2W]|uniref:LysR family transcriptional regulator n=1 Tax=Undibacterium sp. MH2W TaxID=3413044 RepID=UPI003BF325E2